MKSDQAIEAWIESMRDSSASGKEAALIRRIFKARAQRQSAAGNPPVNEQRWNEFVQRMQAAQLQLRPAPERSGLDGQRRATNQRRFAIAAGIGVLALGLSVTMPIWLKDQPVGEVIESGESGMRGGEQAIRIQSADPAALADRIVAILGRHKLLVRRTGGADRVQLQAKVPSTAAEVRSELAKLGVQVPQHGRLNILLQRP